MSLRNQSLTLKLKRRFLLIPCVLLVCVVLMQIFSAPASAQMERGIMGIFQNGKEVGRIYVPARSAKADRYSEYWFLYPDYVYPSQSLPGLETVIIPLPEKAASLAEFRKTRKFAPGTRSVKVLSQESQINLVDDPDEGGQ